MSRGTAHEQDDEVVAKLVAFEGTPTADAARRFPAVHAADRVVEAG